MTTTLVARIGGAMRFLVTNGLAIVEAVKVGDIGVSLATLATLASLIENLGHFSILSVGTSLARGSDISHVVIGRNRTPSNVTYTTPICPNCLSSRHAVNLVTIS